MRPNLIPLTLSPLLLLLPLLFSSIPLQSLHSRFLTHAYLLDQCDLSLAALLMDPTVNACMPIAPIEQLNNGTNLTPKLVNDTSTTFCAMPFCSSATVSLMETTFSQNCVETPEDIADTYTLYGLVSLYVPFKQGMCQRVQDPPTNGTFCITVLVQNLLQYSKEYPNKTSWEILANKTATLQYFTALPTDIVCTSCNQAMINPLNNFVSVRQLALDPAIVNMVRNLQDGVQAKCGENFIQDIDSPSSTTTSRAAASFSLSAFPVLSIVWITLFHIL